MTNRKEEGAATRKAILDAGLALAGQHSLDALGARQIGKAAGVKHTLVFYHFGSMSGVRNAIAAHAIERDDKQVVARLIVNGHHSVDHWSRAKRRRYVAEAVWAR